MMLELEEKHLLIINTIFEKYDYSFFAFSSRVKGCSKKFSDLDLFYFETLPRDQLFELEDAFEDSDLPYKVDLLNYNECDEDFRKCINGTYVCLKKSLNLERIEQNTLGHFMCLPQALGFNISVMDGVTIIYCGLGSSMFNIAYGTPKDLSDTDKVAAIKKKFNGQPFAWWIPPSQHDETLTNTLLNQGFIAEVVEHAMICDLREMNLLSQKTDLIIQPVLDQTSMNDFISVLVPYDNTVQDIYGSIEKYPLKENLFVGYENNKPVTIGLSFISNDTAGIFSLLTRDEVQKKGYGTDMMRFILNAAKAGGCAFATLSASSDSGYRIYEKLGFSGISTFECFEYAGDLLE